MCTLTHLLEHDFCATSTNNNRLRVNDNETTGPVAHAYVSNGWVGGCVCVAQVGDK
jgi:hypothetical protein